MSFGDVRFWPKADMSNCTAFEGKADMTFCGSPLSRSLLGVKQTSLFAAHMSAFDPKRTWAALNERLLSRYDAMREGRSWGGASSSILLEAWRLLGRWLRAQQVPTTACIE